MRDTFPGRIVIRWDEWRNWPSDGWEVAVPHLSVMLWVARQVEILNRPFMMMDHEGVNRPVLAVVNARIGKVRHKERRLYVVYTYAITMPNGTIAEAPKAAWGELLFLDAGLRTPPPSAKIDPRTWWMWWRERLRHFRLPFPGRAAVM